MCALSSPQMQSGFLPLATALIAIGLIRMIGGSGRGATLAGFGLALGALVSYWAIFRFPAFPPAGATNKLFYILLAATTAGFAADLMRSQAWIGRIVSVAAGPLAVLWIGGSKALESPWPDGAALALVALVSAAAGARLPAQRARSNEPATLVFVLSFALAVCAFLTNAAASAQLVIGLGAATGGFLLWNWPRSRFAFGASALRRLCLAWRC